ncbi:uncharacterized protein LOC122517941 [Polistes fuscatus]|uniref:uncharacterized protein LOC122517941 n=1 Tax=Polistes fuscatus TaxID=30207 RepID=UPI001CA86F6A|nr:uncharacterized protein LOC122517941 [Polistes fuscatus]
MEEDVDKKEEQEIVVNKQACSSPNSDEQLTCSLYLSCSSIPCGQDHQSQDGENLRSRLEEAIGSSEPSGKWQIFETSCGFIITFERENDVDNFLQHCDFARLFEGPVQVARFAARDTRYKQFVLLRDVPWAIPLQELSSALEMQGIATGIIERSRQYVRVELLEAEHYELLLRQGLDFFGVARFSAIPERWWRPGTGNVAMPPIISGNFAQGHSSETSSNSHQGDRVLQCYRCQGFWHVAANCRHLPRCVRCGEPHSVEFCPRPRNNPICCHCSGPHHAGYRQCPVRLQLSNATPISITLSTTRLEGQYSSNPTNNKSTPSPQGLSPLKPNLS